LRLRAKKYGADFFLFANTGTQVAGDSVDLPAAVREELNRGQRPGGRGPGADGRPPRARPPRSESPPRAARRSPSTTVCRARKRAHHPGAARRPKRA
jgi:hypothetical protein